MKGLKGSLSYFRLVQTRLGHRSPIPKLFEGELGPAHYIVFLKLVGGRAGAYMKQGPTLGPKSKRYYVAAPYRDYLAGFCALSISAPSMVGCSMQAIHPAAIDRFMCLYVIDMGPRGVPCHHFGACACTAVAA